jgi:hypothetical protein
VRDASPSRPRASVFSSAPLPPDPRLGPARFSIYLSIYLSMYFIGSRTFPIIEVQKDTVLPFRWRRTHTWQYHSTAATASHVLDPRISRHGLGLLLWAKMALAREHVLRVLSMC